MGTITIHSNKAEDLYFINELARRLNLKTEIDTPSNESTNSRMQPVDEAIPISAVDGIIKGMKEVRAHQKGEIELGTLDELMEELENER